MANRFFITGVGTDIGKTIASTILVESWKADYWKPVQAGMTEPDHVKVDSLISNNISKIHPPTYKLQTPASPHISAAIDKVQINIEDIEAPNTTNDLIIEGAGGLMVPLNETHLMIDLIPHLEAKTILISRNYLGAINHTILSLEVLEKKGIEPYGIIFCGGDRNENMEYIQSHYSVKVLGVISELDEINKTSISKEAIKFAELNLAR